MPPGLSDTVVTKRTRRWSAARPRSITRPRTGTSMLPPHRGITTFFPGVSQHRFNTAKERERGREKQAKSIQIKLRIYMQQRVHTPRQASMVGLLKKCGRVHIHKAPFSIFLVLGGGGVKRNMEPFPCRFVSSNVFFSLQIFIIHLFSSPGYLFFLFLSCLLSMHSSRFDYGGPGTSDLFTPSTMHGHEMYSVEYREMLR